MSPRQSDFPAAKVIAAVENVARAQRRTADLMSEVAGVLRDLCPASTTTSPDDSTTSGDRTESPAKVTEFDKSRARKALRRIGVRV